MYKRQTKHIAYARAGVPEYWIFRPQEREVLVHSDPEPATGLYLRVRHIPATGELVSPTLPLGAPVATFFPELSLTEQRSSSSLSERSAARPGGTCYTGTPALARGPARW